MNESYFESIFAGGGEGEDFLTGQLNFFTKTAVTPKRQKIDPKVGNERSRRGLKMGH